MRLLLPLCALLVAVASPARAEVELAGVFGDNMVLQRDRKIAIWGTALQGEEVTVTFDGQSAKVMPDTDRRWQVEMGPFAVQAARELTVKGSNTITLKGVCVGDVWVCSGQSNMAWPVKRSLDVEKEITESLNPRLRVFTMNKRVAGEPQRDFDEKQAGWSQCNPDTVGNFSAVAYYFARQVRLDLAIPVGIIVSAWGGTPAESWTRRETLLAHDATRPVVARWDLAIRQHPEKQREHQKMVDAWKRVAQRAKETGRKPPRRPSGPLGPTHRQRASGLWNGMIAPLVPMRVRGFLWYQGESNSGRAEQYATLFPAMISDWRAAWKQGDLPFLFVQLANFRGVRDEPVVSAWAELRDAQRRTLRLPKTAMAVAIDIGDAKDIHPKNKQEVGRRLALAARALVYPEELKEKVEGPIEYSGPLYSKSERAGRKVMLSFTHLGGGLRTRGDEPLTGFTIAGADKVFHVAKTKIDGDQVAVWHAEVSEPIAVRYGWADNPVCNLINAVGLPASPFRTDNWPGVTAGKR